MIPLRTFDLLERYISLFPEKCALSSKIDGRWVEYSGRQYADLSTKFCLGLIELGYKKADKVLSITNNRPEWNFVDMGISMAGMVHVPVYTSLSATEYHYIINHSDAKMVLVSDKSLYNCLKPICDSIDKVKHLLLFDRIENRPHWSEVVDKGSNCSEKTIRDSEKIKSAITGEDLASIIYTSGTTGTPKGVMLSHKNLVKNFLAAAEVFSLTADDRFLSILPLCHVGGRLGNYQTQYSGATIYYAENMGTIAANLKEIEATGFDAVPRILEKVYDGVISKGRALKGIKKKLFFWAVELGLRYQPFGLNSWIYYLKLKIADRLIFSKWRDALGGKARIVGCGGAALQPRLERVFWAAGLKIINMYGLTETSPIITINRQYKELCRLGSVGALIEGVEVKIAEDGEILCKGDNIMMGYYKDEELTKSVFDKDGWFMTGDVGSFVDNRFLQITDRKKEIFKLSSGKFIAPQVIENRMKESLFIDQIMVTGEHEKFASALIVPDFSFLKGWCKENGVEYGRDNCDTVSNEKVRAVLKSEVDLINSSLAEYERVLRIRVVPDIWSPATGELSASLKLKRSYIEKKYIDLIDNIYRRKAE
jgi:long-chain acyl-CoA synthetase